ncbi:MAG: putative oxidoreductase [Thermoanaerobaculia bacterium]|nr:putative oxidoreductase [Thermoanaerobaculia bacterium]
MAEVIGRFSAQTFALLRIIAGLMFAMHGTQKLFGWPPSDMMKGGGGGLPPLLMAAGVIELVCGLLIAIGFFTGIAAFIASGEMAVAYFMGHAAKGGFWPIVNKGELAALYCFVFLFIAAHGAGIWSLDNVIRRKTPVVTTV